MRTLSLLSVAALFAPFIVEASVDIGDGLTVNPDIFGDRRDIVLISRDTPAWKIPQINGKTVAPPSLTEIVKSTLAAVTTGLVLLPPLTPGKLTCAVISSVLSLLTSVIMCSVDPEHIRSPSEIHARESFSSRFHIAYVVFQLTRTIIGYFFGTAAPLHLKLLIPAVYSMMVRGDWNGRRMARFAYSMVIFWLMVEWIPKLWQVFTEVHPLAHY